jgi:hypothetical protein
MEAAELGTDDEFNQKLSVAMDPLAQKIVGAPANVLIEQMPHQMSQWIRDSTSLWIKNKGAGTPTTEEAEGDKQKIEAIKAAYE